MHVRPLFLPQMHIEARSNMNASEIDTTASTRLPHANKAHEGVKLPGLAPQPDPVIRPFLHICTWITMFVRNGKKARIHMKMKPRLLVLVLSTLAIVVSTAIWLSYGSQSFQPLKIEDVLTVEDIRYETHEPSSSHACAEDFLFPNFNDSVDLQCHPNCYKDQLTRYLCSSSKTRARITKISLKVYISPAHPD